MFETIRAPESPTPSLPHFSTFCTARNFSLDRGGRINPPTEPEAMSLASIYLHMNMQQFHTRVYLRL
jgi:hypothetical protein